MSDFRSEGLSFFEDISATDKLIQIIRNANEDIVDMELKDFIKYVAELELEAKGGSLEIESVNTKIEQISMRLMSSILSQNE